MQLIPGQYSHSCLYSAVAKIPLKIPGSWSGSAPKSNSFLLVRHLTPKNLHRNSSTTSRVIGTDTDRSPVYDFLLVIHSNVGLSCTVSEINDFCRKSKISPTPCVFNAPAEFPLEFCNSSSAQKTRFMPVPDGGKSLTICEFISTQYQSVTDRRTDGQVCHNNVAVWMHRHAAAQ